MSARKTVGVIGARGYVGAELLALIAAHPKLDLAYASSRQHVGKAIEGIAAKRYESLDPAMAAARGGDVVFLALPNGLAADWVAAFDRLSPKTILIDLSADYRFDDVWAYGLPEHSRATLQGATRIANPGCYASAAQIAIAPVIPVLAAPPVIFGVSGYSGAGTTPSPRNNPDLLKDNMMPYGLTGHIHEREISRHLGINVCFMPHVAAFFRGLSVTVNLAFNTPMKAGHLRALFEQAYENEPFIKVSDEAPQVCEITNRQSAHVGGFARSDDGCRAVMVCVLDNLLKGAASQAIQNLNLALGFDESAGLAP